MKNLKSCLLAVSATLVLGAASVARADVTVSTSTDPRGELDLQMRGLLGTEKSALGEISGSRLSRLAAPVKTPSPRGDQKYSRAWIDAQPVVEGDKAWQCLTQALYFEARGESIKGQFGVAEVILNRVESAKYPDSVCAVINQGTGRKYACQFTYTCDGRPEHITEKKAWDRVGKVARLSLATADRPLTEGATHYHTTAVRPSWSRQYTRTTKIGVHIFYRQYYPKRTASR